jgi:hypothetical protein
MQLVDELHAADLAAPLPPSHWITKLDPCTLFGLVA